MPRFAYVNGAYVPHRLGAVHVEDRGYQFADGVYEVIHAFRNRLIDEVAHLDRLDRSLHALSIDRPMARRALRLTMRELLRRNRVKTGLLYIQVTRGVAPRDHKFPAAAAPSLVMTARAIGEFPQAMLEHGVKVVTMPDIRWGRCDIKSVSLLANVLGKQQAAQADAYEAWMVDDTGAITEGASSNAWIVTPDNTLVTRPLGPQILAGITRTTLLALADEMGYAVEERTFSVDEACRAKEAFLSSSSHFVTPVTQIDDSVIANGSPGGVTTALHRRYVLYMEESESISSRIG